MPGGLAVMRRRQDNSGVCRFLTPRNPPPPPPPPPNRARGDNGKIKEDVPCQARASSAAIVPDKTTAAGGPKGLHGNVL